MLQDGPEIIVKRNVIIPKGYKQQVLDGCPGYTWPCPVRNCRRLFKEHQAWSRHFTRVSIALYILRFQAT